MNHKIDYEHRIKNITYEDTAKQVFDRLGYIKTKSGVGMRKIVAIYSKTTRNFWWVR